MQITSSDIHRSKVPSLAPFKADCRHLDAESDQGPYSACFGLWALSLAAWPYSHDFHGVVILSSTSTCLAWQHLWKLSSGWVSYLTPLNALLKFPSAMISHLCMLLSCYLILSAYHLLYILLCLTCSTTRRDYISCF